MREQPESPWNDKGRGEAASVIHIVMHLMPQCPGVFFNLAPASAAELHLQGKESTSVRDYLLHTELVTSLVYPLPNAIF